MLTERERKDALFVLHTARQEGRISPALCAALCALVERLSIPREDRYR